VIERVRQAVGPDYPVGFRLNGEELPLGSGLTLKDTSRIAVHLQQAGIDMIHVSVGNVGPSLPLVVPPGSIERGFNVYAASAIKRVVDIPVIAVGRVTDVRLADKIVRHGHADLVAMGRASLADPDFPKKAMEGRFDEILMCLGCTDDCVRPYRHCSTNPELGREAVWSFRRAGERKTVWVVGGGVAGVEAAVLAARRGHRVTLFEQKAELGGQIHAASAAPHKGEFVNALTNRLPLLEKYRVDVRLGTRVALDMVRRGCPDAVVLATGALPQGPPIPGAERPEVVQARDVLVGDAFVGHKVAVLGGGEAGAETAEYLAHYHRDVTLIEMLDTVARDMAQATRSYLIHRLRRMGVTIITGAKVESITDLGVVVSIDGLKQLLDGFSSIVLAMGSRPDDELAEELRGVVKELHVVGDARQVGRIADATAQAAEVALGI
jgi:NADPH-dependent 2,4-dienoyl-CoA reductase/sulfur reductase-like enzyme